MNGGGIAPCARLPRGRPRADAGDAAAVLIFDEVITGLPRGARGGAGAVRRRPRTSRCSARRSAAGSRSARSAAVRGGHGGRGVSRTVSHVGTFNANPICAAAALAAVTELERRADELYPTLEATVPALERALLEEEGEAAGIPLAGEPRRWGGCSGSPAPVTTSPTYDGVQTADVRDVREVRRGPARRGGPDHAASRAAVRLDGAPTGGPRADAGGDRTRARDDRRMSGTRISFDWAYRGFSTCILENERAPRHRRPRGRRQGARDGLQAERS